MASGIARCHPLPRSSVLGKWGCGAAGRLAPVMWSGFRRHARHWEALPKGVTVSKSKKGETDQPARGRSAPGAGARYKAHLSQILPLFAAWPPKQWLIFSGRWVHVTFQSLHDPN